MHLSSDESRQGGEVVERVRDVTQFVAMRIVPGGNRVQAIELGLRNNAHRAQAGFDVLGDARGKSGPAGVGQETRRTGANGHDQGRGE
jgi:hypothetical protein